MGSLEIDTYRVEVLICHIRIIMSIISVMSIIKLEVNC
jgi:hypothetical protein